MCIFGGKHCIRCAISLKEEGDLSKKVNLEENEFTCLLSRKVSM